MRTCPICKNQDLEQALVSNVEVDYCPQCMGLWFEDNELSEAKDNKDANLRWLDVDLWKDKSKFKISQGEKLCPQCRLPLYELDYGDSNIKVDVCSLKHGVWLDRGEYKLITDYLKKTGSSKLLHHYTSILTSEVWEVFSGPKSLRDELGDVLTVLKLLKYKLLVQHPILSQQIINLAK